jgi:hypothetical protein
MATRMVNKVSITPRGMNLSDVGESVGDFAPRYLPEKENFL